MSRRNFRKTDAHRGAPVTGAFELTLVLPDVIGFAVAPGPHGWGVTVEEEGRVRVAGASPHHAARLLAMFLVKHSPVDLVLPVILRRLPAPRPEPDRCETWRSLASAAQAVVDAIDCRPRRCTAVVTGAGVSFRGVLHLDCPRDERAALRLLGHVR